MKLVLEIERDLDTGLFVGGIEGLPGAHSQGATLSELLGNLGEVLEMLGGHAGPPFAEWLSSP